jgi:hypothetical protein
MIQAGGRGKSIRGYGSGFIFMEVGGDIREAIDTHPKGALMRFEVTPGSKRLLVPSGFNPWRRSLLARLTKEPTGGRANRELEQALADLFGIGAERVQVTAGQKSSRKVVIVLGVDAEEAVRLLSGAIEGTP